MGWRKLLLLSWIFVTGNAFASEPQGLIILGAQGEPEYGIQFRAWGDRLMKAFSEESFRLLDGTIDSPKGEQAMHRQAILDWITMANDADTVGTRWLVFFGHGTFDRTGCKINLAGPDLSATELAASLKASKHRWVIVIGCSSSGPFLPELSGANRVVIVATKSGAEQNYSRFGDYFSLALNDAATDLDHDNSVSVLEAFLSASNRVARFYEEAGRLATEQSLMDDNGDKRGTPGVFFRGLRAVKAAADGLQLDGELARRISMAQIGDQKTFDMETLAKADEVEREIESLRKRKTQMPEVDYYQQLEVHLARLADLLIPKPE